MINRGQTSSVCDSTDRRQSRGISGRGSTKLTKLEEWQKTQKMGKFILNFPFFWLRSPRKIFLSRARESKIRRLKAQQSWSILRLVRNCDTEAEEIARREKLQVSQRHICIKYQGL